MVAFPGKSVRKRGRCLTAPDAKGLICISPHPGQVYAAVGEELSLLTIEEKDKM